MFGRRNRQQTRSRRPLQQPLALEALEDRDLLSATPTTILDLNGLTGNPNQYSSTDILVQFQQKPGTPGSPAVVAGTKLGAQLPLETNFYQVNLDPGMSVAKALSAYQAEKGVLNAEPDYELSVSSVPNDPLFNQQWALNNTGQSGGTPGDDIKAENAWSVTTGSRNIIVAVLDTGIDYDHIDLAQNIWINQADIPSYWYTKTSAYSGYDKIVYKWEIRTATPGVITMADLNNPANAGLVWKSDGNRLVDAGDLLRPTWEGGWEQSGRANDLIGWNFVNNNNNPMDGNGHGTNVAGILGATGNNGTGTAGVAWNVQIMPVEFMGPDGTGSISNFIQALNYAVQHGAKITNNSWEGAPYSAALYDAFQNAQEHGVICVAAAGNEGSNDDWNPDYPASLSTNLNNVVTVAATTSANQLASFSNYGLQSVDLAAPGVNILSTLPNNQYGAMSGTSMAAPEVAGAMALVWSLHPTWSYTQVINQVLDTTQRLPSLQGKVKTAGLLDLAAAVGYSTISSTSTVVTNVAAQSSGAGSFNSLVVTFNQPINVNTIGNWDVTLTNPYGQAISMWASVVSNSGNKQIQLHFANQTILGNYKLSITSGVRDTNGETVKPYQSFIALQGAKTYSNWTPTTIRPKGTLVSTIAVPEGTTIGNIQLSLNVSFPYDNELYVYLMSPTGKTIALDYNRGGWRPNLTNTVFSETASTPIGEGRAPFTGAFLPEQSLSQLNGSNAGGNWRLGIFNSGGSDGRLLNWSITITPPPTVSASSPVTTASASRTYTHSTISTIAAKGTTVSSMTVPAGATIGNIQVSLNATFPYDGDLYLYLISPSGKSIALDYDRGDAGKNFTDTVFTQSASSSIAQGRAPFSGSYRPEASLSQLNGSSAGGTWRLGIVNYGPYTGRLLNWSLTITPNA